MRRNYFRPRFNAKMPRDVNPTSEKTPASRFSDPLDVNPDDDPLGYARIMIDLLKDPVSLGLKGGSRGYRR